MEKHELQRNLQKFGFLAEMTERTLLPYAIARTAYKIVFIEADSLAHEGDLARQVSAIKNCVNRPAVIGVMSKNRDNLIQKCMSDVLDDVMESPINIDALYEAVCLVTRPYIISRSSTAKKTPDESFTNIDAIYQKCSRAGIFNNEFPAENSCCRVPKPVDESCSSQSMRSSSSTGSCSFLCRSCLPVLDQEVAGIWEIMT